MKERIRESLLASGAVAVGFAKAGSPDHDVSRKFSEWIEDGCNAGMDYLSRHAELRKNTDNLLPGSKAVISLAFCYAQNDSRDSSLPMIASYAFGKDYHDVIRKRLKPIISLLKDEFGGEWRICVDSAPIEERYWAVKSGIGTVGKNGAVIVAGYGSYCFLAEIITTLEIMPDKPSVGSCIDCYRCVETCPTGAILNDKTIDSRKCFSYLTIEKKGEFNEDEKAILSGYRSGVLFGCDICLNVCPHNKDIKHGCLPEFKEGEMIKNLSVTKILEMDEEEFRNTFRDSSIKRAGLQGLQRNAYLTKEKNRRK